MVRKIKKYKQKVEKGPSSSCEFSAKRKCSSNERWLIGVSLFVGVLATVAGASFLVQSFIKMFGGF